MKINYRFILIWLVPVLISLIFWYQIKVPTTQKIPFIKAIDRGENILGLKIPEDEKFMKLNEPKAIPDDAILQLLQIPKEIGYYKYCISHQAFAFNIDEVPIPTGDALFLQLESGSILRIENNKPICFEQKPKGNVIGFAIDEAETQEQIKNWGVRDQSDNTDNLSAYDELKYYIELKYESLLLILPIAFASIWWGFLILYSKVITDFANVNFKEKSAAVKKSK